MRRLSTLFAFLLGVGVFAVAAFTSSKNPGIFMNGHAALVVFGGTFAAAAISFRFDRLRILMSVFARRIFRGEKSFVPQAIISEIMVLSEIYRTEPDRLHDEADKIQDPFLQEAVILVAEGLVEKEHLIDILLTRTSSIFQRYNDEALKFKALAKFPPAFGLMGAVMGMVGIMAELGSSNSNSSVGPSLALALVGTLYGVALSNIVILPLAENLLESAREIKNKNLLITEAVHMMLQKKNSILMAEDLNSFLLADERLDWKQLKNKVKAKEAA